MVCESVAVCWNTSCLGSSLPPTPSLQATASRVGSRRAHRLAVCHSQTDNPFVNAGIMYIQNVRAGDAGAWVLEELNRRIERFTYTPESVRELPHSGWSTPPHFANADEQARPSVRTDPTPRPTAMCVCCGVG